MDHARAWKHDTGLGSRLTDPAFGLLGRDAVLTITGLQYAGKWAHGAGGLTMALTITNHLVRSADAPRTAG